MQVTTFALVITKYRAELLWFNTWFRYGLVTLQWLCAIAMPIMAIAARNHYTVDVVVRPLRRAPRGPPYPTHYTGVVPPAVTRKRGCLLYPSLPVVLTRHSRTVRRT